MSPVEVARAGRYPELLATHDEWRELAARTGQLPQRRTLAVLRALALEATGAEQSTVAEALEQARELAASRVDYLATRWPELAQFLARHGLASDGPTGAAASTED